MDVHDQDSNHGPDDMSTKIEAEVKIEVESDAESDAEKEDGEKTVSTTSAKSVKQELVKSGSHLFTLSIGTFNHRSIHVSAHCLIYYSYVFLKKGKSFHCLY